MFAQSKAAYLHGGLFRLRHTPVLVLAADAQPPDAQMFLAEASQHVD
jgi:hypothetical protein